MTLTPDDLDLKYTSQQCYYDIIRYLHIFQRAGGKLAGGRVEIGEEEEPAKKKRKIVMRVVRPTVAAQFRGADLSDVTQVQLLMLMYKKKLLIMLCMLIHVIPFFKRPGSERSISLSVIPSLFRICNILSIDN